jgi:5-methylcytosine-specific restriction endonuclease McrA
MLRRRAPIGRRARRRMRAGPRASGRPAASVAEWKAIRQQVLARAGWRCQACGVRRRLDVHHVVKRSQGGSDFDLDRLVALCRWCHDQTDAPYERGRLVVTVLGAGQFRFEVVQRPGSGTPQARVPTFAHLGKIHPFDGDRDSSMLE